MIPVIRKHYKGIHLRCEGWNDPCDVVIDKTIGAFDAEDLRERVLDEADRRGWTTDYYILCKDCSIDRANEEQQVKSGSMK